MRWRRRRAVAAALLGLGIGLATPREARAAHIDASALIGGLVAGFFLADVTFATYDIVVTAQGQRPSTGWSIAETAVTAPQTLLLNPLFAALETAERDQPALLLLMVPTMTVSALSTHGIWSLASDTVNPAALHGVSALIGADATLTISAASMAINGRLSHRSLGVAEILCTLPQVILGSYELSQGAPDRGAWIGLTAWSGTLLLHGVASTIWGGPRAPSMDGPPAPPPSSLPAPLAPPAEDPSKPPLLVPSSLQIVPTLLSNGIARVPALVMGGVF